MTLTSHFSYLGLIVAALVLAGCGTTQQHMNLSAESLATPAHTMSHADYPFDPSGRYIDSWAAEGAGRYGNRVDTDHQDHGREQRKQSAASKATPSSSRNKSPTKKPPTKARSHTVKRGDSLYSLSRRYGVSVQSLKNANGLKSDSLRDGRKLVIPR